MRNVFFWAFLVFISKKSQEHMSYSRFKMLRKIVNGIPQDIYIQGDLIQSGPFDTYDECNEGNASPSVTPDTPDMLYRWVASNEPWCDGTDEYKTEKQQQSADSGKTWVDSGATRKGEFVLSHSFTCGFVAERWIEVNPNVDFICENGNKFYLQKKEISTDGVNWTDSGDKRKGPLIEANSADCGYPQTRWVEISLDVDYVCVGEDKYYKEKEQITNDGIVWQDTGNTRKGRVAEVHSTDCGYEPPTTVTRWIVVEDEFICQGVNKHQKEKEQISEDSGQTWQDTGNVRAGSLIEKNSYSCGYVSFRWVDVTNEYVCQGYDKYQKQNEEKTTDGKTWTPTGRTRTGALIEKNSYSCGYVSYRWVTVENEYVCQGYDKYTKEKEQSSTDGSLWQDTGRERAGSLIERDSSYCKEPPTPVKSDYLTFTALEDGTFRLNSSAFREHRLYYSFDKVEWTRLAVNTSTPTIAAGNKIYFKGKESPSASNPYGVGKFSSTGRFTASGTPMSLLFGDDFEGKTSLNGSYAFYGLFSGCTKLTSIDGLSLPATTLTNYCYDSMFDDCTGLTSIPINLLPATTLTIYCYCAMFGNCTGLTSIPTGLLPSTTLTGRCYSYMFSGCTGLTSIPINLLTATTLANECYYRMFANCSNITTAPDLLADTLATNCYERMFYKCAKLNSIRMLATDVSAQECLLNWVSGVASSGTFYKSAGVTIPSGESGIPSDWTVVEV